MKWKWWWANQKRKMWKWNQQSKLQGSDLWIFSVKRWTFYFVSFQLNRHLANDDWMFTMCGTHCVHLWWQCLNSPLTMDYMRITKVRSSNNRLKKSKYKNGRVNRWHWLIDIRNYGICTMDLRQFRELYKQKCLKFIVRNRCFKKGSCRGTK